MFRLDVKITAPARVDLVDTAIPGNADFRSLETDEVYTPVGLPLRISVELGLKGNTLFVHSAGTEMARTSLPDYGGELRLLLPTEERLRISVYETR